MKKSDLGVKPVQASGTFRLGDRVVHRLGYGAMQITGPGIWGPPPDRDKALRVLRRAVDRGVDFVQPHRPRFRGCRGALRTRGPRLHPLVPDRHRQLARPGGPLEALNGRTAATPSQLALAWLLGRSPVMLPIPGTSKVAHLEENCAAAEVELDDATMKELDALA